MDENAAQLCSCCKIKIRCPKDHLSPAQDWYKDKNTSKSRAEDFAKCILNKNLNDLFSIKKITRENTYKTATHDGKTQQDTSNREEERIALAMFAKNYPLVGKVIDYQVPLKDKRSDKGIGKIDVIAYHTGTETLTLLELKKPDSTETLLRAVLEVFTYWQTVDHKKLLADFGLPDNTKVEKAVLLFENSYAFEEYKQRKSPHTIELMETLDVKFYGIKEVPLYGIF